MKENKDFWVFSKIHLQQCAAVNIAKFEGCAVLVWDEEADLYALTVLVEGASYELYVGSATECYTVMNKLLQHFDITPTKITDI